MKPSPRETYWVDYLIEETKKQLKGADESKENLRRTIQYYTNKAALMRLLRINKASLKRGQQELNEILKTLRFLKRKRTEVNRQADYLGVFLDSLTENREEMLRRLRNSKQKGLSLELTLPGRWKPWDGGQ